MAASERIAERGADRLRIADFSDREILALFLDMGGAAAAREMAQRVFGLGDGDDNLPHYTRCVTSRFVWMRRYGLVDRADDGRWQISPAGVALRTSQVPEALVNQIDRMGENRSLDLAHTVGVKLVDAGEIQGRAMQRELTHQINRRRTRLRGW
jgi:hypothetical protein